MTDATQPTTTKLKRFPRLIDYAYTLAIPDVAAQVKADQIQIGCVVHNASDGPMMVHLDAIDVKLDGCIQPDPEPVVLKPVIIAKGLNTVIWSPIYKRISATPKPSTSGSVSFQARYGHPDWEPVRRTIYTFNTAVIIAQQAQVMSSLVEWKEEEIEITNH